MSRRNDEVPRRRSVAAYETVIAACRKHGKWVGIGGVRAQDHLRRYIGMGVSMVLAGGDLNLMIQTGKQTTALVRGCVWRRGSR